MGCEDSYLPVCYCLDLCLYRTYYWITLHIIIFLKIVVMFDTFIVINYNKSIEGGVRHEII